ncbi:collagen alpha-1(I) chain-like isoform X2 [Pteropus medius]|uniref:collagen alpha-1(I) chain-like isoform X2 n=1 Tax=Pteropus vampyrus TaxID=132908 RepID=UPI00196AFB02|nr:collagen alpha-1(I) chain-like isoform X2 [Pteropus giganteus]
MVPRLLSGGVSQGQSRLSPGGGRSETASVNARSSSRLLLRPGRDPSAMAAGDAGPGAPSPSAVRRAAKRPEGGQRHTKNAVSGGGGGGERGRPIRDGSSRPCPLVPPPPPGLGPRPRRQCSGAHGAGVRAPPAQLDGPGARPGPSGRPGPRPGEGRPLAPAAGDGSRAAAAAAPGNLRAGKSLRRLRGAARRGPPLTSAVTACDFLDSSSARAAARTAGTAGRAGVGPRAPAPGAAGLRGNTIKRNCKKSTQDLFFISYNFTVFTMEEGHTRMECWKPRKNPLEVNWNWRFKATALGGTGCQRLSPSLLRVYNRIQEQLQKKGKMLK